MRLVTTRVEGYCHSPLTRLAEAISDVPPLRPFMPIATRYYWLDPHRCVDAPVDLRTVLAVWPMTWGFALPSRSRRGAECGSPVRVAWWRQGRRLAWIVPITAVGLFAVVAFVPVSWGAPVCSVAQPCGTDPAGAVLLGLLSASAIVIFVHRWVAVLVAGGFTVHWLVTGYLDPTHPAWLFAAPLGYLTVVFLAARAVDRNSRRQGRLAVSPETRTQTGVALPMPERLPIVGLGWLTVGAALFAATAGLVWWSAHEQARVDAQQRAADVVTGVVVSHVDDYTPRVRLSDGRTIDLEVLDVAGYPVGSPMSVYLDDHGLRQPVSEPYDASGWLALAAIAGGAATAALARGWDANGALRRLFGSPQPAYRVDAAEWPTHVVLVSDQSDEHATVFPIPVVEDPFAPSDPYGEEEDVDPYVPATLYGHPSPGQWCAVQVNGRLRIPVGPISHVEAVTRDPATGRLSEPDTDEDDELPVDPSDLLDRDRDAAPEQLRQHRVSPIVGWIWTVWGGTGVPVAVGTWLLPSMPAVQCLAVVAVLGAVGYELAWRYFLRPRLVWNAGGVAAVLPWATHRIRWTVRGGVRNSDKGWVEISADGELIRFAARQRLRLPARGERTAGQLTNALRHARQQGLATTATAPDTPHVRVPSRPLTLVPVWAITSLLAAWLLTL